jgi:YfiH family protein
MIYSKVQTIQHPFLSVPNVVHGFFERMGGVSQGSFASLNMAYSNGDNPDHVTENRKRAMAHLGLKPENMVLNKQIHSNKAIYVDKPSIRGKEEVADGLVTDIPHLVLGVFGADCPPVLFADPQKGIIGAAHAGWKGALSGILESTIDLMVQKGARREHIKAIIGPAINQDSYEVSASFLEEFVQRDGSYCSYFMPATREQHFFFDLKGFCADRLRQSGLQDVDIIPLDTYSNPLRFFSYRRICHLNEKLYGNNLNVISLCA